MRIRWCGLVLGLLMCTAHASEHSQVPAEINLVSEAWIDYTDADGSGLAWDVLREVFEPEVTVQIRSEPYTRAIGLVLRNEADAWVGSYLQEAPGTLYPRWHYDNDQIYALGLATMPVPSAQTLGDYRLAWVRGYTFQNYLPAVSTFNEVRRRDGILLMLSHKRVDYYIDALAEVDEVLSRAKDPALYRRSYLARLPLYLGFSNNPRGVALLELYDRRMGELVKSGRLRAIFQRWKQPYPFDTQT